MSAGVVGTPVETCERISCRMLASGAIGTLQAVYHTLDSIVPVPQRDSDDFSAVKQPLLCELKMQLEHIQWLATELLEIAESIHERI